MGVPILHLNDKYEDMVNRYSHAKKTEDILYMELYYDIWIFGRNNRDTWLMMTMMSVWSHLGPLLRTPWRSLKGRRVWVPPIAGWFIYNGQSQRKIRMITGVTRMDLGNLYIGGIVMKCHESMCSSCHPLTIRNPLTQILSNHYVHCMSYFHAPRCSFCRPFRYVPK